MVIRKRKNPTPGFQMPSPHNPQTGGRAPLQVPGVFPHCALMQVASADTNENYVICRGYDPRHHRFFEYELGNDDKYGISVAKPWYRRAKYVYQVGEVIPAILPLTGRQQDTAETYIQHGQNPGQATAGQPKPTANAPLVTDGTEILYDVNGKAIDWMFLDGEAMARVEVLGELNRGTDPVTDEADSADALIFHWDHEAAGWREDPPVADPLVYVKVWNTHNGRFTKPATTLGDTGADGFAVFCPDRNRWELVWMEMPGMFYGTLQADLSHSTLDVNVTVINVITGYDLWGVQHTTTQAVKNPVALSNGRGVLQYWFAGHDGDSVLCQWSETQELFGIIAVEPNSKD